jgi:hypothetical protein
MATLSTIDIAGA